MTRKIEKTKDDDKGASRARVHRRVGRRIEGTLPPDDLRRAFVAGAKWWEFYSTGGTMWQLDRNLAEEEAERRYPNGKLSPNVRVQVARAVAHNTRRTKLS